MKKYNSLPSFSHLSPNNPTGHKHLVPLVVRIQLPPFKQRPSHVRLSRFASKSNCHKIKYY